jgi:hypothetical protein
MLSSNIKFEIDINNNELLGIMWEHTKEIKRAGGEGDIIEFE